MAISRDAKQLCVYRTDGGLQIWNLETRQIEMAIVGKYRSTLCMAFTPDGQTLASAGAQGTIKLWEAGTARESATLRAEHTNDIRALSISPDGRRIVSGGLDRKLVVWDIQQQRVDRSRKSELQHDRLDDVAGGLRAQ